MTARITYLPVGAQRDGGRPGVTAGGTSIALADTDPEGFGARGRCARVFSAERMLILTALTTTRVVAAADGLRCAGASDGHRNRQLPIRAEQFRRHNLPSFRYAALRCTSPAVPQHRPGALPEASV